MRDWSCVLHLSVLWQTALSVHIVVEFIDNVCEQEILMEVRCYIPFSFPHTCSIKLKSSLLLCLTCWCVSFFFFQRRVVFPVGWAGKLWARTGCYFDVIGHGHSDTGDCGNILQCNGVGPARDVTSMLLVTVTVTLVTAVTYCSAMVLGPHFSSPRLR
jgi:hypothetical protein